MQLGRYSVSTLRPPPILSITYGEDGRLFTVASETGYEVWRTWPLALVRRRVLPGALARVVLLPASPLVVLQGGGAAPLYSPNKAVIYHDKLGTAVAELEFGERIRGIAARQGTICIALLRKVVAFEYGVPQSAHETSTSSASKKGKGKNKVGESFQLNKVGEWETVENEFGLMALSTAPGSTLLALPGRQAGHVQLVQLSPCPSGAGGSSPSSTPFRSPIILAHTHALSTLSCAATGSHIITTSERGTLLRVWDTSRGRLERELRRGVDRAEMWGVEAEHGGKSRVVGWSDKATIHVWAEDGSQSSNQPSRSSTPTAALGKILSRNLPLPKYFSSTASMAQYRLPRKNPHAFSAALGAAGVNVPSMRTEDDQGELSERFVVGWVEVEVFLGGDGRDEKVGRGGKNDSSPVLPNRTQMQGSAAAIGMGTREERHSFGSGSDNTSRTATPTMARRSETPTLPQSGRGRRGSMLSVPSSRKTSASNIFIPVTKDGIVRQDSTTPHRDRSASSATSHHTQPSGHVKLKAPLTSSRQHSHSTQAQAQAQLVPRTKIENHLIAITYSGDWYRLRVPEISDHSSQAEGEGGAGAGVATEAGDQEKGKTGGECELVEYRRLGVGGGGW